MQITVFGASGKVGRLVVMQALKRGHSVVAFVHRHDPFVPTEKLKVFKGDITDTAAVQSALKGSEAVISTLGSWGTKDKNVLSTAMRTIIPAMAEQKISRIITLTGAAAFDRDDVLPVGQRVAHLLFSTFAGKIVRDGEDHIRQLHDSAADWTIIRSPVMTQVGNSTYHLNKKLPSLLDTVSRQSVAKCLLDQLETKKYVHQAPVIYRR